MNVATQITGNIRPGNTALCALKAILTYVGINVTHPTADESLFCKTDAQATWRKYDDELEFYRQIARSSFHVVYNDGEISEEVGTQIAYAMLKRRPIIMTGTPVFASDLSLFLRDTIKKHLHEFHPVRLSELELTELSLLLNKLKPTDYRLSKSEKILINAKVKTFFRKLLEEARNTIRPIQEN